MVQVYIFRLGNNAHPASTELFNDVVVRDRLIDHASESYVGRKGKSMKAGNLAGAPVAV